MSAAAIPVRMYSINNSFSSQFLAAANVGGAKYKEANHNKNVKNVLHTFPFRAF